MTDQTEPIPSLQSLPNDLLLQILYELDLSDHLKLRLVSKKFREVTSQIALQELAYDYYCLKRNWYHIDRPVHNKIVIPFVCRLNAKYSLVRMSAIFKSPLFDLTSLKRLRFAYAMMPNLLSCLVEHINKFISLEQLEFLDKHTHGSHRTLRLPKLKVLFLYNLVDEQLRVDSPELRVVHCECPLKRIHLKEPKSVHDLHVALFEADLAAYRNVQRLTVQRAHKFPTALHYNLLNRLHHLNELRIQFEPTYGDPQHINRYDHFYDVQDTLCKLVNEKKRVHAQTTISFEGVQIDSVDQVKQLERSNFAKY